MEAVCILFEDEKYVFALKAPGVLSESAQGEGMVDILSETVGAEVFPLHRLDRAVGGVMVFAKTKKAAAAASRIIANGEMSKEYLAVVCGFPDERGRMDDLLFKDSSKNKSYVVKRERRGVKKASLRYERLDSKGEYSLVRVALETGRSHQIRVQFSSRGMPLLGDGKYGRGDNKTSVALWSCRISFKDGNKEYSVCRLPKGVYPWNLFDIKNPEDRRGFVCLP